MAVFAEASAQRGWLMRAVCRPYGFLERFDPDFTPNTTDLSGRRYTYRNQTMIGHWNSAQLANAFITGGLLDQVLQHPYPRAPGTACLYTCYSLCRGHHTLPSWDTCISLAEKALCTDHSDRMNARRLHAATGSDRGHVL